MTIIKTIILVFTFYLIYLFFPLAYLIFTDNPTILFGSVLMVVVICIIWKIYFNSLSHESREKIHSIIGLKGDTKSRIRIESSSD